MSDSIEFELLDKDLQEKIIVAFNSRLENYYEKDDTGKLCFVPYNSSVSDLLNKDDIAEIASKDNPLESFECNDYVLDKQHDELRDDLEYVVAEKILPQIEEEYKVNLDLDYFIEEGLDKVHHNGYSFDNVNVECYLLLAGNDFNYDFGANSLYRYACNDDLTDPLDKVIKDPMFKNCAISNLIRQQGYEPNKFICDLYRDKGEYKGDCKFLASLASEIVNNSSYFTNALVACVKLPFSEICRIKEQKELEEKLLNANLYNRHLVDSTSKITLDKDTVIGLYDPWNGASSQFKIKLEKDLVLPLSCFELEIDKKDCNNYGYAISEVCGGSVDNDKTDCIKKFDFMSMSLLKDKLANLEQTETQKM